MTQIPFTQRLGIQPSKPIDNDFPKSTRIALAQLISMLSEKNYLKSQDALLTELHRTGRLTGQEFDFDYETPFLTKVVTALLQIEWFRVYIFCERIYDHVFEVYGYFQEEQWAEIASLAEVRRFFTDELNLILAEDNLAFHFVNGRFQRRGRAQTQNNFQRVGTVLSFPILSGVRDHYNKARKFFDERPKPDVENCVKEALCALEACLEVLTKKPASNDFAKVVKQFQGNEPRQIPPPIAEGMIKLHAYRGSGQGVAHAAPQGNRVSEVEAELVLSLVATYITYLVDLFSEPEAEVPF
jgi:hypothetical protein